MSKITAHKKPVPCPTCKKSSVWDTANPWRPFCSERCRLVDLGDWFEERNRIADSGYLPAENDT